MTFELDFEGQAAVCLAKYDWKGIPSKGNSRIKGRKEAYKCTKYSGNVGEAV